MGSTGTSIVAKRSYSSSIRVERLVYEEILPTLSLSALRCYGSVEDEDGRAWLFLEDAGGRPYSEDLPSDRVLAAKWLGAMHAATADRHLAATFPAVELDEYLDCLRLTRTYVLDHLARRDHDGGSGKGFQRILDHLDGLERCWCSIVTTWGQMPHCLVHRDFIRSNVRVRDGASGSTLHVIDWGRAAWGVPATDLAGLDFDAYWCEVRGRWSHFGRATIRTMANLGDVLRYLDWMEGTGQYLASSSNSEVVEMEADLLLYEGLLARARITAGLL